MSTIVARVVANVTPLTLAASCSREIASESCVCQERELEEILDGESLEVSVVATAVVVDPDDRLLDSLGCRLESLFRRSGHGCRIAEAELLATRVWRGRIDRTFYVGHDAAWNGCGPKLVVGKEYLLFVYDTLDGAYASRCLGLREAAAAQRWIEDLGQPQRVF